MDKFELIADFKEALELLQCAGPNPLSINSDEYWDRYGKLMDKYCPEQEEDEDE